MRKNKTKNNKSNKNRNNMDIIETRVRSEEHTSELQSRE